MDKTLILNRIKEAYNLKSNAELSRFLNIAPNTVANWYSRNSIDFELIFLKCTDLNTNWLLTGNGQMYASEHVVSSPESNGKDSAGFGGHLEIKYISLLEKKDTQIDTLLEILKAKEFNTNSLLHLEELMELLVHSSASEEKTGRP